ncbi:septum formation family protein [Mycolicibacterium thermoresistibile]
MTGPPGGYPPPPPQPYSSGNPPPPPPPKRRINWWIVAASVFGVLAALVIGAVLYLQSDRSGVDIADVEVGQCVAEVPDSSRVTSLPIVDCTEQHRGEVFAVIPIPDGDYPTEPAIEEQQRQCRPALDAYAPPAAPDRPVEVFVLAPSEQSWSAGHRTVTCIAITDTHRTDTMR